jgi:hypothetical protein
MGSVTEELLSVRERMRPSEFTSVSSSTSILTTCGIKSFRWIFSCQERASRSSGFLDNRPPSRRMDRTELLQQRMPTL